MLDETSRARSTLNYCLCRIYIICKANLMRIFDVIRGLTQFAIY